MALTTDTFPDWLLRLPADLFQDVDRKAQSSLYVGQWGAETTDKRHHHVRLRTRYDIRAISLLHQYWTVSVDPYWWCGNHWGFHRSSYDQAAVEGYEDFPGGLRTAAGILNDVEDLKNVDFILPGQCLTRYRSWKAATGYWMKVLRPFDELPAATKRTYIVECAERQYGEDAVQCQHRGCLSMAQALKEHTEASFRPIIDAEQQKIREAQSSSPLLRLPAELQQEIFGYIMPYHQGDTQGTGWLGRSMSNEAQNCMQGWGRNRVTTAFLVSRHVYQATAKIYFGTNAQEMDVCPGYLGFAGHRLDSKTTNLAQLPPSVFLVKHWQIVVKPWFVRDGLLTSKALIVAHPLWMSFQSSVNLANQTLLANDNVRSIKVEVFGLCDLRFETVELAVEFWTWCFEPLGKLRLEGPCRFRTVCWSWPDKDDLSDDIEYLRGECMQGQCEHKDCVKLIKALGRWMAEVNPTYRKP
ncbi:MAG: hypothetical protein Q9174_003559 [Haloplaca sp. 1 TL-2023]